MKIYRQGDIFLQEISSIPKDVKPLKGTIVAYGEVTGHSHRIENGKLFEDKDKRMYFMIASDTRIVHDEHKPIKLQKGAYAVIRQREYTSGDMTKLVVD